MTEILFAKAGEAFAISELDPAPAYAAGDYLHMYDSSAGGHVKTTLSGLFANVPGRIQAAPASGFDTGGGGYLLKFDTSGHNADAPPFGLTTGAYAQEGQPDNVTFRLGFGLADGLNVSPPLGSDYYAFLGWENDFWEASVHNHEFYYQVGPDDGVSPDYVRPIFFKMDISDLKGSLITVLSGKYVDLSDTDTAIRFFRGNSTGSRFYAPDGGEFGLWGSDISNGIPTAGALAFRPYSSTNRQVQIGFTGGSDETFVAQGSSSTADLNPARMIFTPHGSATGFVMRRNTGGSVVSFGFGISPADGSPSGEVQFAEAGNLKFGTTTGTKIGTSALQKIGLWAATPVVQPSSTGEATGFTAGSGTGVNDDSTFTGNVGSTGYRMNDVVKHLKTVGLLAA